MPNDTPAAIAAARALEEKNNGVLVYTPDQVQTIDPPHKIYIFNLGPTRHEVPKGSLGTFVINPCLPGQAYSEPLILPSIVRDSFFVEQELKTHSVSGEFTAQDIVHPIAGSGKTWWSYSANYDNLGVFWTKNNPPTDEEIAAARQKMEETYRKLLSMANSIEAVGRLDDITPLMRVAAHYFGEDRPWNKIYRKTLECPGCGEAAKPGIIRHPCGYVFDPDRALLAGMISEELHKQMVKARQPQTTETKTKPPAGKSPTRSRT